MAESCLFCKYNELAVIIENKTCFAIKDKHPVSKFHCLIIPFAHKESYFGLSSEEVLDSFDLLEKLKRNICLKDPQVTGFNIGMNCGKSAGQSIFHCHIHLIPRRSGDVKKAKGGVRHLIPDKGNY